MIATAAAPANKPKVPGSGTSCTGLTAFANEIEPNIEIEANVILRLKLFILYPCNDHKLKILFILQAIIMPENKSELFHRFKNF